jgi:DNA topoisomerase-1
MKEKVIIVESPSKAKTLNSYFNNQILVLSSRGHIRDLSTKGKENLGINIEKDFKPDYQIIPKQKEIVKKIIKLTKNKKVFLATDPDREGEAIAFHLAQVLKLKEKDKNRISFNEINKQTVLKSFETPSIIKKNLVDSQEARRILDRIIGFKLSNLVRKIKSKSAGRVQSVALKLIVDLEEERQKFVSEKYYLIKAFFEKFQASLKIKPENKKIKKSEAEQIIKEIKDKNFLITKINEKEIINKSPLPFITSTLQQESFKNLSMSAKKTMFYAQKLYEGIQIENQIIGLITYMRTDSYRISENFEKKARLFIQNQFGSKYLNKNKEKINNKKENVQDAHEAIRPTDIQKTPESLTKYLNKNEMLLYSMIYKRTLSSFMANAIFKKKQFFFNVEKYTFITEENKMIFDGYYKILNKDFVNEDLFFLKINQKYLPEKIEAISKETTPPPHFTEASLIKKLEYFKIGRPSTYAHIIETLKKRLYVYIEKKKMICTQLGIFTKQTLENFFPSIINIKYTSQIEKKLDDIYYGKMNKLFFLKEFYDNFCKLLNKAHQQIKKTEFTHITSKLNLVTEQKCSLCGDFLVQRQSRYGNFLGCQSFPKCKNIVSDNKKKTSLVTEQKCSLCGDFLVQRQSRYGNFLGCQSFPKCKNIISDNKKIKKIKKKKSGENNV